MATIYTYADTHARPLYRGTQVVWFVLGVIEALLAFRFVLRLLGANAAAPFTHFIYSLTYPLVAPFLAVFSSTRAVVGSTIEWSTLLAMLVYWIVATAIVRVLWMSKPVTRSEAAYRLERQA